jgi:serine/threonine protein kinase
MTELKSPVGIDVGTILGARYRLDAVIGEGGMARVFRAEDVALTRTVAIKVMRAPTDGSPVRVQSETTLLASLSHPSLVTLFDAHISEHEPSYLVMEYVDGPTLAARLAAGPLPPPEVAALAVDLAEALHVVHEMGVVHRDIKPSNVLLWNSPLPDRTFRAKLTDFGIARLLDSTRVTLPGTVIGTAAYLAPEQVRGEQPSSAADIYSLGLMLLEALTGKRAFGQAMSHESLIARLTVAPTIPHSVPDGWRALLTAMTASNPPRRPTALQVALAATILRRQDATADDVLTVLEHPAVAAPAFARADSTVAALTGPPTETAGATSAGSVSESGTDSGPYSEAEPDRTKVLTAPVDIEHARPAMRPKGIAVIVAVIALLVAGATAVGILVATTKPDTAVPTLPAVEEPLGTHLDDLLESVTP